MKRFVIYAAAALLAMGGAASAESAAQPTIDYDTDTGRIYVTGNLGKELAGEIVSLTVYKTNPGISGVAAQETGTLNWYDQTTADSEGGYSFDYLMVGENSGVSYTFSVAADGLDEAAENEFTYYPTSETTTILQALKEAKKENDAAKVMQLVEKYATYLQLDTSYYSLLADDAEKQQTVCENILTTDISTISNFKNSFAGCSVVVYMNSLEDAALYEETILKLADVDAPASANYFRNSGEDDKGSLVDAMMRKDFILKSELLKYFKDEVLSNQAESAGVWGDMYALLESAKSELSIDFTEYEKLGSSGSDAIKLMLGKSYSSCEDIVKKFNSSVESIQEKLKNKNSGGNGGSSGGSSTGSSLVSLPQMQQVQTIEIFADIANVAWAKDSIENLYRKGIVSGDENGNFNPQNNVSRAEFVKMLVSAMGMGEENTSLSFDDVESSAWYYKYVMAAAENGIVSGISESSFGPGMPITRQDAAAIIYRALLGKDTAPDAEIQAEFTDKGEISEYAKEAVNALAGCGMINGMDDGSFAPKSNMTRAQAAVIINGFVERMEGSN
ncbi:MAG: S-layer homology domain-containing protein [Clostridia bacterium]|nr:S-layer homology domain-containing protein [Clostridia bacterium]